MIDNIQGGVLKSSRNGRTITVLGDTVATKEELLFQECRDKVLIYSLCVYYCVELVTQTLLLILRAVIFPSSSLVEF